MSSVSVTIQELFESGQAPSKICNFLKGRASRSNIYKVLKRLKETESALSTMRSTPSRKVRTPKLLRMMQTVLKNDLNLSPYKITKAQLLFQATKTKRLSKASSGESEG